MTNDTNAVPDSAASLPAGSLTRREAISAAAESGSKLATVLGWGAIPLALAAISRDAAAQTATDLMDALQFLLLVENLQAELYLRAQTTTGLIPAADVSVIGTMRVHDSAHVQAMTDLIIALSGTPAAKPSFDFTAKGAFAGFNFSATQYATFLIIAQGLKDLAERVYKSQAARMSTSKSTMTAVLTYGAVEARHAAEIRLLRGKKAWITGASRDDLPAFFQPVYDGEDVTVHAGFDSATLASANGGANAVTESFDEPLAMATANVSIIQKFLA